ncbi:I78 family peptidase inhibitor [Novosphingobium lentum]|uniref:I78 family peptidase inhibitor n=1 Tax=Novosphingobium lentum TaxID=145287 RepID=UPI00082ABBC3|nr:I78 family peptidase inhibitor [Novosphingobium lentum]
MAASTAPPTEAPSSDGAIADNTMDKCHSAAAARFVSATDSAATRDALRKAVGNVRIRWVHPGEVVTQDYSEARLNIMIDETSKIASARCG